ncbi:MAG: VIT1/CCC1 transporter family protein [Ferroplasma sp.]
MDANAKFQLQFLRDELTDMVFYTYMYRTTADSELSDDFKKLATTENEHANFWGESLKKANIDLNKVTYRKTKYFFMKFIRRIIGNNLIINLLEHGEYQSIIKYKTYLDNYTQDNEYKKKVNELITAEMQHEEIFARKIINSEKNVVKSRDFLYGMSDGLVEVLATLAGLTAIISGNLNIALGGIVVGISGTFSMTLGSYLAQKSESEYRIAMINRKHIFSKSAAIKNMIDKYSSQAKTSALYTALSYMSGAIMPILPFIFLGKYYAIIISVILVFIAQGISNSIVALSLNTQILKAGIRAALLSLGAAAITFGVGEIFHLIFHITLF